MKISKLFLMAALALTLAACSNDDNDIQTSAKAEGITITATLAPKDAGASTRALSEGDNKIVASWAVDEEIAILYEVGEENKKAVATIKSVDSTTGAATIEFTVADGTPDNTECTLIYPASAAKDDNSGIKDDSDLLKNQSGTLNANLDIREGAGKISSSTASLDVTTQPAPKFAIWKLMFKDQDGNDFNAIHVKVNEVASASEGYDMTPTSTVYLAVPAVTGGVVEITADDENVAPGYYRNDKVTLEAGKYYESTVTLSSGS